MIAFLYTFYRVKSAEIYGTTYSEGAVVLCGWWHDLPTFSEIGLIFVFPTATLFATTHLQASHFDPHYHAYVVKVNEDSMEGQVHFYQHKDFKDELVFMLHEVNTVKYIAARHHIFEMSFI